MSAEETLPGSSLGTSGLTSTASKPPEKSASTTNHVARKGRSCVVCRQRKVRCDRVLPCSNCRRANIACTLPSTDKPPRWARNLAAANAQSSPQPKVTPQVMERLHNLENLVKDLRAQLDQAKSGSTAGNSSKGSSPSSTHYYETDDRRADSPSADASTMQKQFGRLVLQDANKSRYVSSGFWSRVNDELDGLKMDLGVDESDSSEDESSPGKSPSALGYTRTPSERHGFLFGHNLDRSVADLREYHPLPSQIPFLLNVFLENVNYILHIVHEPTVSKMIKDMRGDVASLTPANEALLFSIYYAAIGSMEEEDVMTNFGIAKTDLNLKYRIGLEHALSKADFLNVPDLVLVQAFAIFISLLRRYDSPRFVWMMTGLLIRMGQALGLHRDGANFEDLTPYEIEMRRRTWWTLLSLDVRAAEDQGTDYTITRGSFDTKFPLNINDADIEPETREMPVARIGLTDMAMVLVWFELSELTKKMMSLSTTEGAPDMDAQARMLDEMYEVIDQRFLKFSEPNNIAYWVGITVVRLMIGKMTLLIYSPMLFSSPSDHVSETIKSRLLVAAIEIAEYNHALNTEQACRQWRWMFQTYVHWYSAVYLLLQASTRPWSPTIERAWVALGSQWLMPSQAHIEKNQRVWVPLRKLLANARKHRNTELQRLRNDPHAAEQLEQDDRMIPIPGSPGPFPPGSNAVELFRDRWRQLVALPDKPVQGVWTSELETTDSSANSLNPIQNEASFTAQYDPTAFNTGNVSANHSSNLSSEFQSTVPTTTSENLANPEYNNAPAYPTTYGAWLVDSAFAPWPGMDPDPFANVFDSVGLDPIDINMDMDAGSDVNWYDWVESTKGMEWNG